MNTEPTKETLKYIDTEILRTALHYIDYYLKQHGADYTVGCLGMVIELFLTSNDLLDPPEPPEPPEPEPEDR